MAKKRRAPKRRPKLFFFNKKKETRTRIIENRRRALDYLSTHPCVDCGETDVVVLEFDHIDRKRKRATVFSLLEHSWEVVEKEIAKCAVRCANCHRRRTAVQLGWTMRLSYGKQRESPPDV